MSILQNLVTRMSTLVNTLEDKQEGDPLPRIVEVTPASGPREWSKPASVRTKQQNLNDQAAIDNKIETTPDPEAVYAYLAPVPSQATDVFLDKQNALPVVHLVQESVEAVPDVPVLQETNSMDVVESLVSSDVSSATDIVPLPRQDEEKSGTSISEVQKGDRGKRPELDASSRIIFKGNVLTAQGGALKVPPESRNLCVLFDTGMWLVSTSHRNSPLVTSVAAQARRQGFRVDEPRYVTPDIIQQAYLYGQRQAAIIRYDENAIRRKIVDVLAKARDAGANDIHVEASGNRTKVEFRIDGTLRLWETWTQKEGEMFVSAVWSHASTQSGVTANWLEPQAAMLAPGGGQDQIALPEGICGVRCQWMPLADGGRYLDMRLHYDSVQILGHEHMEADVDTLGFSPEQTALIRHLRSVPGGMRVIAAPTNAGKSTTLRVMLNRRMIETGLQLNCLLIEDPPEGGVISARQIGISAVHKDEQRERTFLEIMRSALRLDPDVVMLGETRDLQTATFLFRLALTGRQVFTTLHVYSALAIPQRLRDLGIEPYLAYDHNLVRGMMSQRLIRKLCPYCKLSLRDMAKKASATEQLYRRTRVALGLAEHESAARLTSDEVASWNEPDMSEICIANPEGCEHCQQGRQGRTIVAEVIETDARLMELLAANHMAEARDYWLSRQGLGGMSMQMHAMDKVRKGIISPDDAEIEMGPLASDREIRQVEEKMGTLKGW